MAATMRRARTLLLASRCLLPSSTASDHRLLRAAPQRLHPLPAPSDLIASKPVSLGLAGALSFSLTLMTRAEAKEPPAAELVPKDVVLYQYEACPFCNKVKAFLDYHDIPYKVVEVNPFGKKEIKWSEYKKVPILVVDGEQLVESSDIIDNLNCKIYPDYRNADEEETKWRRWVDDHLVHILSPNIYRTPSEALEAFDYIASHGNFSFAQRLTAKYAGAAVMYWVSKRLKDKHKITDERAALYEAAETWTKALNGRDFLGGSKPNLADLAVFGVLRPIRYLTAGKDMVEKTRIGDWYQRMENAVGDSARISA
ncbi:prostaglandin E synthase 2 [Dioscorea cayenensis subsp. rotundata]|uniref:Prostaglandin E synthase 2 n=1 Tax=Dioscorea cayennensis subsp. rotundata TaxID=55577 RepID=A0AB40CIR1_DIOCR|nr:prostaglandin E synthase 2 [Dioscorea cayenensis subsp. rotundata]